MKKTIIFLLFLCLTACTSGIETTVMSTPSECVSQETTPWQDEPTPRPTLTPTINPNLEISEYDPDEWTMVYDQNTVWEIDADREGKIWIEIGVGNVGYFDGDKLKIFTTDNMGISTIGISDMVIAPDNSVWVAGPEEIAHYENGDWSVVPLPYTDSLTRPRLAVDQSGVVWMSAANCDCSNNVWSYDSKEWTQLITENKYRASGLLISPDNTLWASFPSANIGKYDGSNWHKYPVSVLWEPYNVSVDVGMNTDNQGNIYGISIVEDQVVEIKQDGSISKISYEGLGFELDTTRLRIFIDSSGVIWMNAYFMGDNHSNIEYYANDHWTVITGLPFMQMMYMKEIGKGKYLVGTAQGLYEFDTNK